MSAVPESRCVLQSSDSRHQYPWQAILELGEEGQCLEVVREGRTPLTIRTGPTVYEQFQDFWWLPVDPRTCSLGEGSTPLFLAPDRLRTFTGIDRLWLKNETANPTGSFKDRGSVACCALALACGERYLATVSTGNMGHSVAAYAARAGLRGIVIAPQTAAREKLLAALRYGATVVRVATADLCELKARLAAFAQHYHFRITSGNNPVRIEGYKFESFEIWRQMEGVVPDFLAVPTSAGGHIRGLHKGWRELAQAGWIDSCPRMILVQPAANAPLAYAVAGGADTVATSAAKPTVATALTSHDPPGGADLLALAQRENWLAAAPSEADIIEATIEALQSGLWLEPSAAIVFSALRQLVRRRRIPRDALVVAVLTGAGYKDPLPLASPDTSALRDVPLQTLESVLTELVERG